MSRASCEELSRSILILLGSTPDILFLHFTTLQRHSPNESSCNPEKRGILNWFATPNQKFQIFKRRNVKTVFQVHFFVSTKHLKKWNSNISWRTSSTSSQNSCSTYSRTPNRVGDLESNFRHYNCFSLKKIRNFFEKKTCNNEAFAI